MFLSVIPGLGQLYKGQPGRGFLWFIFVLMFLLYAPPIGFLLWVICAGNAALAGAVREEVIVQPAKRHTQPRSRGPRYPVHRSGL